MARFGLFVSRVQAYINRIRERKLSEMPYRLSCSVHTDIKLCLQIKIIGDFLKHCFSLQQNTSLFYANEVFNTNIPICLHYCLQQMVKVHTRLCNLIVCLYTFAFIYFLSLPGVEFY